MQALYLTSKPLFPSWLTVIRFRYSGSYISVNEKWASSPHMPLIHFNEIQLGLLKDDLFFYHSIGITIWMNNYTRAKLWDTITHPYPNINNGWGKPKLKLWYRWIISSNINYWCYYLNWPDLCLISIFAALYATYSCTHPCFSFVPIGLKHWRSNTLTCSALQVSLVKAWNQWFDISNGFSSMMHTSVLKW